MRILFYLQGMQLKYRSSSKEMDDYLRFIDTNNIKSYHIFESTDLPVVWDIDKDLSYKKKGYKGQWSDDGRNICVVVKDRLSPLRRKVMDCIDLQTANKLNSGIVHNKKTLSLSTNAQVKWGNMYHMRNKLKYPLLVSNIDDTDVLKVTSAKVVAGIYSKIVERVQDVLQESLELKEKAREAKSVEELKLVANSSLVTKELEKLFELF